MNMQMTLQEAFDELLDAAWEITPWAAGKAFMLLILPSLILQQIFTP